MSGAAGPADRPLTPLHRLPLVLAAVGVLLLALAVAGRGPRILDGAGRTSRPCGGVTVPLPRGRWRCTFDDEFSGNRLDPARWHVLSTAEHGFHAGPECYVDDARHVRVRGGRLLLTATRAPACPQTGGAYESGMVTTSGLFAQRYGRFEIRARLPDRSGLQPAFWLYPQRESYGRWPRSGEIDVVELFGSGRGEAWPHLHYESPTGAASLGSACRLAAPGRRFHTYGVDWTPAGFRFFYDGRTCLRATAWQPAPPLRAPQPFDRPFYLLLELALGKPGAAAPPSSNTRLPATMAVDWVRVWGP